jgi:hypothetical protein
MRFLLLIIPTILVSAWVFLVFGFLGLCAMNNCLGSGNPSVGENFLGAASVLAASLPFVASLTVLFAHLRKKRLSSLARALVWTVIMIVGAFGLLQVLADPGDAVWAGVPLIALSALLSSSMLSLPHP